MVSFKVEEKDVQIYEKNGWVFLHTDLPMFDTQQINNVKLQHEL